MSSHVLDTASGSPARGLRLSLSVLREDRFDVLGEFVTNDQGRVADLLSGVPLEAGTYRLRFDTRAYLEATGRPVFYPYIEVVFQVRTADEHYHIPLLLSPFGYSTYRGS